MARSSCARSTPSSKMAMTIPLPCETSQPSGASTSASTTAPFCPVLCRCHWSGYWGSLGVSCRSAATIRLGSAHSTEGIAPMARAAAKISPASAGAGRIANSNSRGELRSARFRKRGPEPSISGITWEAAAEGASRTTTLGETPMFPTPFSLVNTGETKVSGATARTRSRTELAFTPCLTRKLVRSPSAGVSISSASPPRLCSTRAARGAARPRGRSPMRT